MLHSYLAAQPAPKAIHFRPAAPPAAPLQHKPPGTEAPKSQPAHQNSLGKPIHTGDDGCHTV